MTYYKRDGTPVADSKDAFGDDKHVARDFVEGYCVSTVHLALDHSFGSGPPLIFETMVFAADGDKITSFADHYCDRYSTEEQATVGHADVVAKLKAGTLEMYGDDE
jgi:hypothetical protein